MPFFFENLDEETRRFMIEELDQDVATNNVYLSTRLSAVGQRDFPELLRQAAQSGNDVTLAATLRGSGRMNTTFLRNNRGGGMSEVRMPKNAPEMLAEGEFNRLYARGVCLRAVAHGSAEVEIYRAKQVSVPRPDSGAKIGSKVNAELLLEDLRTHQGVDPALGLPGGPNSGLSVRLP